MLRATRIFLVSALAVIIFLTTSQCWAQNATGSLVGEVQDATGARVKSAVVTVASNTSGVSRETPTGSAGEFRFADLIPGSYRVVVRAQGFADASTDVHVLVSSTRDLLVTVRPAPVQQTVQVAGQASSIATQRYAWRPRLPARRSERWQRNHDRLQIPHAVRHAFQRWCSEGLAQQLDS